MSGGEERNRARTRFGSRLRATEVAAAPTSRKRRSIRAWAREWRAFTDLDLVTVDGHPDERARLYRRRGNGVLLINYEQLSRADR